MIVVTGATGKLGQHVIEGLIKKVPATQIVAAVRNPEKAANLATLGVQVRKADYSDPQTLAAAFADAEKVLLISSSEIGLRVAQHQAVIDAAKAAGVKLLAYTSLLRATTSTLALAVEHVATEKALVASGLPYTLLRNGWYLENHTESLGPALQHGAILGAAQDGKFAAASRNDYALAAVEVLTTEGHAGKTYELAGDTSFTLTELAAEVSRIAGKPVAYKNLTEAEYETALKGFGLPTEVAHILADSDTGAAKGELNSTAHDLHNLLGRATTPLTTAVIAAVAKS